MKIARIELAVNCTNYYEIMAVLSNNERTIESFESALNDGGLYIGDDIKIGRYKPRKYIVLKPCYQTNYSDIFRVILTDDINEAYNLIEPYLNND